MARAETILLNVCLYLAFLTTISSTTPILSDDDRLIEELEELSNIIHSKSHQSPTTGEVENAIYPEVGNQPPMPLEEELQILDEHINLPTTLPSAQVINQDEDSIELQLFEVGRDEEGNRIYEIDSDLKLGEELESLENESVGSAFEEEDDHEDLEKQLEEADLVKQLEDLPHHEESPTGSIPSLTAVPAGVKPSEETSDTNSSSPGESSATSGDYSPDGSGGGADVGSGDGESIFKETLESSGDGTHLFMESIEGEGSGALLDEEGFVPAVGADVLDEEGSGESVDEISGDDFLKTQEPAFTFTTIMTEPNEEQDATTLMATTMVSKTSTDEIIQQTKTVVKHCPDSHFECRSNHHCVPQSVMCDLIPDCDDQSDEDPQMCTPERTCNEGFFKCGESPQCVDEDNQCDGIYHCYNGEDETNCLSCEDTHGHQKRLLRSDFCDGYQDCKNNMDEDEKRCAKPCSAGYQRCDDGLQCIKEELFCNGIYNCHDKSDEQQCRRTMLDCWSFNMFACDGICQAQSNLCDYFDDCSDRIDEKGCKDEPNTCPKDFIYQTETDTCLHSSLIFSEPYDLLQILDQARGGNPGDQLEEMEEKELFM